MPRGVALEVVPGTETLLTALRACLDAHAGRYRTLAGVRTFAAYLSKGGERADEELLTEPILAAILEEVLGFPVDAYFPQLGRSGPKPDFTPIDLVAHPFVLDAKGSEQRDLQAHEGQIRRYVDQRSLEHGVLFNLREFRVYRRGSRHHDPALSFAVLPLWQVARGEALPGPEVAAFERFCARFRYQELGLEDKIAHVRRQEAWGPRLARGDPAQVDVDFLVERLRRLAAGLTDEGGGQVE